VTDTLLSNAKTDFPTGVVRPLKQPEGRGPKQPGCIRMSLGEDMLLSVWLEGIFAAHEFWVESWRGLSSARGVNFRNHGDG